jgi:hypothetical protein
VKLAIVIQRWIHPVFAAMSKELTMSWENAVAIATTVLEAEDRRDAVATDEARANAILREVRDLLQPDADQILTLLRQHGFADLAADIATDIATFAAYAESPSANQARLIALLRTLRRVIEGMRQHILTTAGVREQVRLDAFPPYANAVALQALLITDKKHRFGPEPVGELLEDAAEHAEETTQILRRCSDLRFHFAARVDEPGFVNIGYTFDGMFELVAIVPVRGNSAAARQRALEAMAKHQKEAFTTFRGVPQLEAFKAKLTAAQSLAEIIRVLSTSVVRPLAEVTSDSAAVPFRFQLKYQTTTD